MAIAGRVEPRGNLPRSETSRHNRRRMFRTATLLAAALLLVTTPGCSRNDTSGLLIFAPSSTTDVFTEVARAWTARGEVEPTLSFAATSQLAAQIQAGSPADVFMSADERWM